ncbi:hypothetical protein Q757_02900 [Oenococcus alcoholitolerans]|uniref:Uncharacterized protein n=1 Tax=Oenococcus alcoholitolerans TaxID=931074 RepID=A0ABR4XRK6_9LACO|nr:hypothetical protein Q757_02900 [Oenococcus alcoholitolerans]
MKKMHPSPVFNLNIIFLQLKMLLRPLRKTFILLKRLFCFDPFSKIKTSTIWR